MAYKLSKSEEKFLSEQKKRLNEIIEINRGILEKFKADKILQKYWCHLDVQYELWKLEQAIENAEQALDLLVSPSYESREDFLEAGRQAVSLVTETMDEAHTEEELQLMRRMFKAGYFRGLKAEIEQKLLQAKRERAELAAKSKQEKKT